MAFSGGELLLKLFASDRFPGEHKPEDFGETWRDTGGKIRRSVQVEMGTNSDKGGESWLR